MQDHWTSAGTQQSRYQPMVQLGHVRGAAENNNPTTTKNIQTMSTGSFVGMLVWGLIWISIIAFAVAGLIVGAIALHKALNQSTTATTDIQCNHTCTYCEPNGTSVMPWGGRSEQQFSTNTIGVGPLFASLNTANYTPYNICTVGVGLTALGGGGGDDDALETAHRHRRRRFLGYNDDFSWRTQRAPPPGYSIANGDNALAASMEVDGSAFIVGNLTSTCGAYIGCEMLSPVGNFTILYTYNTSGMVYFQVYPAIEALRVDLVNLTMFVSMLNGSNFTQNVTYLEQQVDLLWVAVNNLTVVAANQTAQVANLSATLVILVNETDSLSNFVYNVLAVEVAQLEVNITLVSAVANAALACCNSTNATLVALAANISALEVHMLLVQAEIASLQGNVSALQADVLVLQGNMSTLQAEVGVLQSNVTTVQNEITILQGNATSLTNATNVLEIQVLNLTACCNATNSAGTLSVGPIGPFSANGATIVNNVLQMSSGESITQGLLFGYVDDGSQGTYSTYVGYGTPSSTVSSPFNAAQGYGALGSLTGGAGNNVALGMFALPNVTTASECIGIGANAGTGLVDGIGSIYIGHNTAASAGNADHEYVFGSWRAGVFLTGSGNNTYTLDIGAINTGSNPDLQISATGQLTQASSSMVYKNALPDPSSDALAQHVAELHVRAFTFKDEKSNRTRYGFYAEEVEAIVDANNASVYEPLLNYRLEDDTSQPLEPTLVWVVDPSTGQPVQQEQMAYPKKQVVDNLLYANMVVVLVEHCKWLAARCAQAEQHFGVSPPAIA